MAVVFSREVLTDAVWEEALPLLQAHWLEVSAHLDILLDPDRELYAASHRAGIIRFYGARSDGRLVGYALFFVRPNPHYRGSVQAAHDVLYVDPAYRGLTWFRFIQWCDDQLRAEGVQLVAHHAKNIHPQLSRVLDRLGYTAVETIWQKRLDLGPLNGDHLSDHRGRLSGLLDQRGREGQETREPPSSGIDRDAAYYAAKPQHDFTRA